MELESVYKFSYSICEGCLSYDRKLTVLTDDDTLKLFNYISEYKTDMRKSILLCWECTAILNKTVRFQSQVKYTQDRLKYMTQHKDIQSLSRLSIHSQPLTTIENDYDIEKSLNAESEPLFIKVEEDDCFNHDYGDDDDERHKDTETLPEIKQSNDDDFNDSDDEPLHMKKKEKEYKPRGRRKKKESTKSTNKKGKREKAAGVVNNPRVDKKLQQLNVNNDRLEMVVLSWEEVEEERQKALASVKFTRHTYKCHQCVLGFNHKFKLDNHMVKHDASSGEVMCNVCTVRCKDSHALSAHRRRHRVRWRCRECGATSSRAAVAADHATRAHHAPPPTHTCKLCGHSEPTLGKLRNHIKNHSERQRCELCGKTFRDRTSLRTHLFIHKGEKEYSCPQCEKKFLFKKAMEIHLVTHDASAHLYCYDCDMNFKNRMSYYQHMKYNLKHIDPAKLKYNCELCDKKFVKATRLEEHKLAIHLKVTPVQCTVQGCNFACSSRAVLRTHTRMLHRNVRAVRNHVCDVCGKAYTTKKTLEGHIRSHTGERPFECQICQATFRYEAALYNHNKLVHLKPKAGRRAANVLNPVASSSEGQLWPLQTQEQ